MCGGDGGNGGGGGAAAAIPIAENSCELDWGSFETKQISRFAKRTAAAAAVAAHKPNLHAHMRSNLIPDLVQVTNFINLLMLNP